MDKDSTIQPQRSQGNQQKSRIENWATRNTNIKTMRLSETQHRHDTKEGGTKKVTPEGKEKNGEYRWYLSSGVDPKHHEARETEIKEKGKSSKETTEKNPGTFRYRMHGA